MPEALNAGISVLSLLGHSPCSGPWKPIIQVACWLLCLQPFQQFCKTLLDSQYCLPLLQIPRGVSISCAKPCLIVCPTHTQPSRHSLGLPWATRSGWAPLLCFHHALPGKSTPPHPCTLAPVLGPQHVPYQYLPDQSFFCQGTRKVLV